MALTDVEAKTSGLGVTCGRTDRRVVLVINLVSKISVSTAGSLQVCEGVEITGRSRSTLCYRCNLGIGAKLGSGREIESICVRAAGLWVAGCTLHVPSGLGGSGRLRHWLDIKRISCNLVDNRSNSLALVERDDLLRQTGDDIDHRVGGCIDTGEVNVLSTDYSKSCDGGENKCGPHNDSTENSVDE